MVPVARLHTSSEEGRAALFFLSLSLLTYIRCHSHAFANGCQSNKGSTPAAGRAAADDLHASVL
eukprot:129507-Alexandrium_andersonii.AAC.1